MIDWDIFLRLSAATVIGGAIGLDRDLRGKPTGVRTMGIVALGAALVVIAAQNGGSAADSAAASRVIQGVITGIGFLGAGVIVRTPEGGKVHGLTTAAAIWLTAGMGVACGSGAWTAVLASVVLMTLILTFGKPLERAFDRRGAHDKPSEGEKGAAAPH